MRVGFMLNVQPPMDLTASPFRSPEEKRSVSGRRSATRCWRAGVRRCPTARGFHQTSLDDVAASLGISKPTIYHDLGKQGPGAARMREDRARPAYRAAEDARTRPGTRSRPPLRLLSCVMPKSTWTTSGAAVIRTGDEALMPESRERFRELKRRIDTDMRTLIIEGVADGSLAPCDS
jgi:AcrR family transcriptional regulator